MESASLKGKEPQNTGRSKEEEDWRVLHYAWDVKVILDCPHLVSNRYPKKNGNTNIYVYITCMSFLPTRGKIDGKYINLPSVVDQFH